MHGLLGAGGGAAGAVVEDVGDERGMLFEVHAALLDGREGGDDGVGGPAFAFDAADAGGCAACVDFGEDFLGGENFVQVADGAYVGVAGIGAADARGVGDHGLELGANFRLGVREQDGVAVALGHLAAVGAGQFGRGCEEDLGFGKNFGAVGALVELVEAAGDLAGELDVGGLVLADRDGVGLVDEDVGGLEERVAEEAVGGEVLAGEVLLLLLVGGDALQPAERRDHGEEQMQFGVLGDVALDEEDGAGGVEAGGEVVDRDFDGCSAVICEGSA